MTTQQRRAERVKGYHLHLTDIKSGISNIVLVLPDISSYINQNCAKFFLSSNIGQLLIHTKIATLTRHMEKSIVPKVGSIPVPESQLWRFFPQILWEHSNDFTASVPKILVGKTLQQGLQLKVSHKPSLTSHKGKV